MASKVLRFDGRQHMHRDTFEIFRYRDQETREVSLHHHDFYEIYFLLSGNLRYHIESRSYQLKPGDVLLISPMELHQPLFDGENMDYERIVLWIDRGYLEGFGLPGQNLAACFDVSLPEHTNLLRPDSATRRLLMFQLEQLIREAEGEDKLSELSALAYLSQVLVLLNRESLRERRTGESSAMPESLVYKVLGYINDHYSEDLSLDELANRFFISKYHLSREFARVVGTSVHRYIIQRRLIIARQMMSEGTPSSEVYQHCGFGDYSNFYRSFRAEYGISPKAFMTRVKENAARSSGLSRRFWEHT